MKKLEILNHSAEDLLVLLRSNADYLTGVRLLALIQIAKGKSSRELEEIFDRSHSRFCVWVNNFNEYGLEGLKDKSGRGRHSRLSKQELDELKNVVLNKSPEEYGYNTATWNGLLLIDYIEKKYHISYKKANIYVILKQKLGLSFQKGKGFYPEQDKEQREEHKELIKKTLRTKK
jgi:transposase